MSGTRARPAQRWPDIMIGVLTLALLGGFGTLLLGQRKPVATAQPQQPPAPVTTIPASPGTVPEPVTVTPKADPAPVTQTATAPAQSATTAPNSQTTPPPAATTPKSNADQAATATAPAATDQTLAQTTEIPPAPKAPEVKPITAPVIPQAPAQTAPAQTTTPPAGTAAPATPQTPASIPAVPPRAGGAVATSANRTPLRSDYRISLGSFSTNATVNTQTAGVNSLGYRVHSIDLGDQYVAQVGPFADEASARQALADIQRVYPGALLYRPKAKAGETASSDSGTGAQSSTGSSAATSTSSATSAASTPAPAATQRSAPSGPTYLQVGAFDRVESAQNLVGTLKDAGFAPTVNNPPDRKTTVMVGPYSGDALLRAETRLDNAGLDHFRVR